MTTNNPEVQAVLVTCTDRDDETILSRGVRLIENHDPSCVNSNCNYEPLVRLSDYEDLKDEFESLRTKTSMSLGVGDGTGNLFVHGDYDSIKRMQVLIFEFEKLRKASSELTNWCFHEVGADIGLTPGLKQVMDITGDIRCLKHGQIRS